MKRMSSIVVFFFSLNFIRVVGISQKEKVKQRPQALNTVELMRVASSGLGKYLRHFMLYAKI